MIKFHENLETLPVSEALYQAQLSTKKEFSSQHYGEPLFYGIGQSLLPQKREAK